MGETGDGVDDINDAPATHLLDVGAARAARLTIAHADGKGRLSIVVKVPTQQGARNGVVGNDGTVFLAHSGQTKLGALVVVSPCGKVAPGGRQRTKGPASPRRPSPWRFAVSPRTS
jgi:hypothetical protein